MKVLFKIRNIKICIVLLLCVSVLLCLWFAGQTNRVNHLDNVRSGRDLYLTDDDDDDDDGDDGDTSNDKAGFDLLIMPNKRRFNKIAHRVCAEKTNLVFIKTMKCATQTLETIFRRFAYLRNLNVVLPRGKNIYFSWPFVMEKTDYRPSKRAFNVLLEHAIYNKTVMRSIMPRDTAYFTIIREPFSHFKSGFHYFNVANITGIKGSDHITEYLHNLDKYETFYKSHEGATIRYCIPDGFSVTKNLLSHCMGMPLGFPNDRKNITTDSTAIKDYIEELDRDFALVMLMEYLPESLVLLRRIMCWSMKDIIFRTTNARNYAYKHSIPREDTLAIHRHWSHVDYLLYDHFNRTFWKKIASEGDSFHDEVRVFKTIQNTVTNYCSDVSGRETTLTIAATQFSGAFVVSPDYCLLMGVDLLTYLKDQFDRREGWSEPDEDAPKRTC